MLTGLYSCLEHPPRDQPPVPHYCACRFAGLKMFRLQISLNLAWFGFSRHHVAKHATYFDNGSFIWTLF